jgi:hypothetical protein
MTRVAGHGLMGEGAPYDDNLMRRGWWASTGGEGRARCQCGAVSEVLSSASARKAWHRQHKAELSSQ